MIDEDAETQAKPLSLKLREPGRGKARTQGSWPLTVLAQPSLSRGVPVPELLGVCDFPPPLPFLPVSGHQRLLRGPRHLHPALPLLTDYSVYSQRPHMTQVPLSMELCK